VPYERGDVLAAVHREGEVLSSSNEEGGIRIRARLADASAGRLAEFLLARAAPGAAPPP
jgi:GTP-binding protein HflX